MVLKDLKVLQFRKYSHRFFQFSDKINFITGQNGSGKTSILEAVYYLALTKSFRTNNDAEVIKNYEDYFQLFGNFANQQSVPMAVNLNYTRDEGKRLLVNSIVRERKADHVGQIPVVIFSPDSTNMTKGTHSERRIFIDRLLSQAYREYLEVLMDFKRRQLARNRTLEKYAAKKRKSYDAYIETQDELLVNSAARIYSYRQAFAREFQPLWRFYFRRYTHVESEISFSIQSDVKLDNHDDYKAKYMELLRERFTRDILVGRTTRGPHRDVVKILLGETDIRLCGSQGEHKIAQLALVFAEGKYLEQIKGEPVIYLLDDLLAYLDQRHCQAVIGNLYQANQVLVTATDADIASSLGFERRGNEGLFIDLEHGEA